MKKKKSLVLWASLTALALSLVGCGGSASEKTTPVASSEETKKESFTQITQEEAHQRMQEGGVTVVDVRQPDEYAAGHIPGAILVVNEEIGDQAPENLPDKDAELLVYCRSGRRSKEAAQKLVDLGYTNVYEFGGILDWPYETVEGTEP